MRIIRIIVLFSAIMTNVLMGYSFYNYSDNPDDTITVVGFKNEKDAMLFMEQMGWTGEVEQKTDVVAGVSKVFMPVAMLPIFAVPWVVPIIVVGPRVAEASIKARFVICEHRNLIPKSVWDAANKKMQKEKDYAASWNWRDFAREEGKNVSNIFFLVFRKLERKISLDSLLGATKPGEKYRTEIVAAGYGNRACGIKYVGEGKPLELYWPFVPAKFKPLINSVKIPEDQVKFMMASAGISAGKLLYEYHAGITMKAMKEMEEQNKPITLEASVAEETMQKEYNKAKKEASTVEYE